MRPSLESPGRGVAVSIHLAFMADQDEHVWTRQEGETSRAFECFSVYRDLGPQRSILEAYRLETGSEGAQHASGHWKRWASEYDWVDRAADYDDYMASRIREELESERIESRRTRIRANQAVLSKGLEILESLDASEASFSEAARLIRDASNALRTDYDDEPAQRQEIELDTDLTVAWPEDQE